MNMHIVADRLTTRLVKELAAFDLARKPIEKRWPKVTGGLVGWRASYLIEALVRAGMLRWATEVADWVLSQRVERFGKFVYAKMDYWETEERYGSGEHSIHMSMIAASLLLLGEAIGANGAVYVIAAQELASIFAKDYNDQGFMALRQRAVKDPDGWRERPATWNMSTAYGRVCIRLWRANGSRKGRERAEAIVRRFQAYQSGPIGLWTYWDDPSKADKGHEDISHGAITMDFLCECYESGLFCATDMMTDLAGYVARDFDYPQGWQKYIQHSGDFNYTPQMGRWMRLARFDASLLVRFYDWVEAWGAPWRGQWSARNMGFICGLSRAAETAKEMAR